MGLIDPNLAVQLHLHQSAHWLKYSSFLDTSTTAPSSNHYLSHRTKQNKAVFLWIFTGLANQRSPVALGAPSKDWTFQLSTLRLTSELLSKILLWDSANSTKTMVLKHRKSSLTGSQRSFIRNYPDLWPVTECHVNGTRASNWWLPIQPSIQAKILHLICDHQERWNYPSN